MTKKNLPNSSTGENLISEYKEYDYLFKLTPRSSSGNVSFTATISGNIYDTATYLSGIHANLGQEGMLLILQDVLKDYLITATDYNGINDDIAQVNEDLGTHIDTDASTTTKGHVELATSAETITGTDEVKAVTPLGLKSKTDLLIPLTQRGAVNGVATLGSNGKLIPSQNSAYTYDLSVLRSYDLYNLAHKDYEYYEPDGMGSIMYRDFTSKQKMNTSITNAVSNSGIYICRKPDPILTRPSNVIESTVSGGNWQTNSITFSPLSNIIDTSESTGASGVTDTTGSKYYNLRFTINKTIDKFKILLSNSSSSGWYTRVYNSAYSISSGSNPITSGQSNTDTPIPSDGYGSVWHMISFSQPKFVYYMYIGVQVRQGGSGGATWYIIDSMTEEETALYTTSIVQTESKSLIYNPTKVIGFFSDKILSGTSIDHKISVNGGSTFISGSLVSTRTDPLNVGYTERRIEFNPNGAGSNIVVKSQLNPTGGLSGSTPEYRRFGLLLD